MLKKIYIYSFLLIFLIGQPTLFYYPEIGSIIFLGVLTPIAMSFINILIINKLSKEQGNEVTFRFNIAQFIFKTVFLLLLTFIGIKIIGLNFKIFVPTLCLTWFVFHIIEGFYTNTMIKKAINANQSE